MKLRFAIVLPLMLLGACSSIVEGTDQTVTVITDPSGATCQLKRGGTIVAVANPTPTSVVLEKSKDNISVECSKENYQASASTLESGFQGMTFGNILFGGIIGVGIDAASGAMHEYPASVTVILPPEKFASTGDRDAFFSRQEARVKQESAESISKIRKDCSGKTDAQDKCGKAIEAVKAEEDARIAALEAQKDAAKVE